jgi:hypothetical protein
LEKRRRKLLYKVGTVAEVEKSALKGRVPKEVYQETLKIVTMLDEYFGGDREVDFDDGGFVFIVENQQDLDYFAQDHPELEDPLREYVETVKLEDHLCCEYVTLVQAEKEPYVNAFFLVNEYEYGITLLIPMSITPEVLLKEIEKFPTYNAEKVY